MKRWLFLTHRWLGVFGCLLMVLWFASGIVMMYVPFPALTDAERLAALPAIERPTIGPDQALAQAGTLHVLQLRLLQPTDTPVYALRLDDRGWRGVHARTGKLLVVDADMARRAAERFAGQPSLEVELIERDQWTVSGVLDAHRPLFAVTVAGGGMHYHAPWIDAVRGTDARPSGARQRLRWADLLAYTVGIAIGCALDARLLRRRGMRGVSAPAGGGNCGAGCAPSRRWRHADRPQGGE